MVVLVCLVSGSRSTIDFDPDCFDILDNDFFALNEDNFFPSIEELDESHWLSDCDWIEGEHGVTNENTHAEAEATGSTPVSGAHKRIISNLITTRGLRGRMLVLVATEEFKRNNLPEMTAKAIHNFASKCRFDFGLAKPSKLSETRDRIIGGLLSRYGQHDLKASQKDMHVEFIKEMSEAGFKCTMALPTFKSYIRRAFRQPEIRVQESPRSETREPKVGWEAHGILNSIFDENPNISLSNLCARFRGYPSTRSISDTDIEHWRKYKRRQYGRQIPEDHIQYVTEARADSQFPSSDTLPLGKRKRDDNDTSCPEKDGEDASSVQLDTGSGSSRELLKDPEGSGKSGDISTVNFEDEHFQTLLDRANHRRSLSSLIPLDRKKKHSNEHEALAHDVLISFGGSPFEKKLALFRKLETELNLPEMNEGTFKAHAVGVKMMNSKRSGKKRREPKVGWKVDSVLCLILKENPDISYADFVEKVAEYGLVPPPSPEEVFQWLKYRRTHSMFEKKAQAYNDQNYEPHSQIEKSGASDISV